MNYIVEYELEKLKEILKNKKMYTDCSNNFVEVYDYEDEYSHNQIYDIQSEFFYYAKKYLKENYSGKYAIKHGTWCIHIVTVEFLNHKKLHGWTIC